MKLIPPAIRIRLTLLVVLLLLCSACSGRTATPGVTAHVDAAAASPTMPSPGEDLGGLSSEAVQTLRSLEKVDDYPLYVMHFAGETDIRQTDGLGPQIDRFSCSLFAALGQKGDMLYGRNFDWEYSPALLLFTDPPSGYASVSMVDLAFLGIDSGAASSLTSLPLSDRSALLRAPSMPFDGMNEYGLAIGMAAIPDEIMDDASYETDRPTIGSIGVIRQILDHARSVDEAVALFDRYNLDFAGGPPIHYLVADPSGEAALIEFYQGKLVRLPNDGPWHLATNHLR